MLQLPLPFNFQFLSVNCNNKSNTNEVYIKDPTDMEINSYHYSFLTLPNHAPWRCLKKRSLQIYITKRKELEYPRPWNSGPEKVATFIYRVVKQNLEGSHKILSITTFCLSALTYVKEQQNAYYQITTFHTLSVFYHRLRASHMVSLRAGQKQTTITQLPWLLTNETDD